MYFKIIEFFRKHYLLLFKYMLDEFTWALVSTLFRCTLDAVVVAQLVAGRALPYPGVAVGEVQACDVDAFLTENITTNPSESRGIRRR